MKTASLSSLSRQNEMQTQSGNADTTVHTTTNGNFLQLFGQILQQSEGETVVQPLQEERDLRQELFHTLRDMHLTRERVFLRVSALIADGCDVSGIDKDYGDYTSPTSPHVRQSDRNMSMLLRSSAQCGSLSLSSANTTIDEPILNFAVRHEREGAARNTTSVSAGWSGGFGLFRHAGRQRHENDTIVTDSYKCDNFSIVKLLVDNGAHLDGEDSNGYTPLMIAVQRRKHALVAFLCGEGCNVFIQNRLGDTAMHIARKIGDHKSVDILTPYF